MAFSMKFLRCSNNVLLMAGIAASSKLSRTTKLWRHRRYNGPRWASLLAAVPFVCAASSPEGRGRFMAEPISAEDYLSSSDDVKAKMELLILKIQKEFCEALEAEETTGNKFVVDRWSRRKEKEGGGITCVLEGGKVFEKAGVNITVMRAPLSPKLQENMRVRGKDLPADRQFSFFAAGVSSVIHPSNPHVPTVHFNFRYFEVQDQHGENKHSWFGGGADLTPCYLVPEDVVLFHKTLKSSCDRHGSDRYPLYKRTCDDYFVNIARGERRGVGGIFFDDLESSDPMTEFDFIKDCAHAIIPAYLPIVRRRKLQEFSDSQREWQLLRRGRYVEFNLVYDRGTKFGFATPGARIESVLVSLPLVAKWQYRYSPAPGSPEHTLLDVLKNPRDWI